MRTSRFFSQAARRRVAIGLCCFWPGTTISAQQIANNGSVQQDPIAPIRPHAPVLWRPYLAPEVPPSRLANSTRLRDLLRGGTLYLTAQDAIALALENNLDVEIARYTPISQAWSVERAEAGGALPGVPSGASQTASVASGQGVLGSQAAAGVSTGSNPNSRNTGNATITQIGPVAQTFDPNIQESTTFSHRSIPQPDQVQTSNPLLIQNQRIYTGSYQQGFAYGGSVNVSYNNHYLNEDAITDVLNPSVAPTLSISIQQNLLQGFGKAVNTRGITVAKINLQTSDLNFRSTVITTLVSVLNAYYTLAGDYENLNAKQSAHEVAQTLLSDSRKQVEIGSLADLDLITAESQVASTQQDLVNAQVALQQDEITLKTLISRTGTSDPAVANARIVPLDKIVIPANDNIPPIKELVQKAMLNRNDLLAEKGSIQAAEANSVGTRNGVLPLVVGIASTSDAGLAGTGRSIVTPIGNFTADPYFVGGIGKALGQIFQRDFPSENAGVFASVPFRNRQAQADYNVDLLSQRQSELTNAKDVKQAQVDALNAVVALRQARAKYDAAVGARKLDEQLLDSEQKKFKLGASVPYNVIQQQRDLVAAQATELAALVSYSRARVNLDQTIGTTLETNHVEVADARSGKVMRKSALPVEVK